MSAYAVFVNNGRMEGVIIARPSVRIAKDTFFAPGMICSLCAALCSFGAKGRTVAVKPYRTSLSHLDSGVLNTASSVCMAQRRKNGVMNVCICSKANFLKQVNSKINFKKSSGNPSS